MGKPLACDILLNLKMGSIVNINEANGAERFSTSLIGIDLQHSIIVSLPSSFSKGGSRSRKNVFAEGNAFELRMVVDDCAVLCEAQVSQVVDKRWVIFTFPKKLESRRLRSGARIACDLPCMTSCQELHSDGVVTNMSVGGCQIIVSQDARYDFLENALVDSDPVILAIVFPHRREPVPVECYVRSTVCHVSGACKVGVEFSKKYDVICSYLESLQLDNVA